MNNIKYLLMLVMALIIVSCSDDDSNSPVQVPDELKIGVISDLHYYDPTLGTESEAFKDYVNSDRKMIAESQAILESVINSVGNADLDIVLVSGDLTKDGEKQNHEKMAQYLAQLEAKGKKVYIVPGNHDINGENCNKYPNGSAAEPIPSVSREEFKTIYKNFGFDEAIAKDDQSLSYIVEPQKNVWIFALDATNPFSENNISHTGGYFKATTKAWIISKLQEAKSKNIKVFGFMHHGIVEHFPGMEAVFAEYLIKDWKVTAEEFAENGLNFVFTGHHHATDISLLTPDFSGKTL